MAISPTPPHLIPSHPAPSHPTPALQRPNPTSSHPTSPGPIQHQVLSTHARCVGAAAGGSGTYTQGGRRCESEYSCCCSPGVRLSILVVRPIPTYPTLSYPIPSHPILLHPTLPAPSHSMSLDLTPSHPISEKTRHKLTRLDEIGHNQTRQDIDPPPAVAHTGVPTITAINTPTRPVIASSVQLLSLKEALPKDHKLKGGKRSQPNQKARAAK